MKLNLLAAFALCAALTIPSAAYAGQTSAGLIADVQATNDNKAVFFVAGTDSGKPSCAVWQRYVIDLATPGGQAMLSILLTAQATGKRVIVYGTNSCSLAAEHETAQSVRQES